MRSRSIPRARLSSGIQPAEIFAAQQRCRGHENRYPAKCLGIANYGGPDNAVEVYVGHLRRKIGAHLIVTVRGAGYRLDSGEYSNRN